MISDELYQKAVAAAQDTPYLVTKKDNGFSVELNVADWKWLTVFYQNKLSTIYRSTVVLDEAKKTYTITQEMGKVEWQAGVSPDAVPQFNASWSTIKGTVMNYSAKVEVGLHDDGSLAKGYVFNSGEINKFVSDIMSTSGLKKKLDTNSQIGLIFGIAGGVIALICVGFAIFSSMTGWDPTK